MNKREILDNAEYLKSNNIQEYYLWATLSLEYQEIESPIYVEPFLDEQISIYEDKDCILGSNIKNALIQANTTLEESKFEIRYDDEYEGYKLTLTLKNRIANPKFEAYRAAAIELYNKKNQILTKINNLESYLCHIIANRKS